MTAPDPIPLTGDLLTLSDALRESQKTVMLAQQAVARAVAEAQLANCDFWDMATLMHLDKMAGNEHWICDHQTKELRVQGSNPSVVQVGPI